MEARGVWIDTAVRRIVRGDHAYLVEGERVARSLGCLEMTDMYGIERAANHPDAPRSLRHSSRRSAGSASGSSTSV